MLVSQAEMASQDKMGHQAGKECWGNQDFLEKMEEQGNQGYQGYLGKRDNQENLDVLLTGNQVTLKGF
jgi:hypothetical protein